MWDDIYDDNFKDMCYLLAIPGISIVMAAIVSLANHFYRKSTKEVIEPADLTALDEADNKANRIMFGYQSEVDLGTLVSEKDMHKV